jgi:hypothetical protein
MERIDPIGPWTSAFPRIERAPAPERTSRERRRQQSGGNQPERRSDGEDDDGEDAQEHVDVTA